MRRERGIELCSEGRVARGHGQVRDYLLMDPFVGREVGVCLEDPHGQPAERLRGLRHEPERLIGKVSQPCQRERGRRLGGEELAELRQERVVRLLSRDKGEKESDVRGYAEPGVVVTLAPFSDERLGFGNGHDQRGAGHQSDSTLGA